MKTIEMKEINMYRTNARLSGFLFITAAVAGILGVTFLESILVNPVNLTKISANENQVIIGALLTVIMAGACASIAIPMYPILKKHNETIALGAVGFRIIEGVFLMISAIIFLLLLTLSQEFVQAGAQIDSYFQTLGELLVVTIEWINIPSGFAFSLGALIYYYLFYQSKLVPRWLAGWGLISVTLGIVDTLFITFGFYDNFSLIAILLNLSLIVNEMVLALWLIFKGFNSSGIDSESIKTVTNKI